MVPVFRPASWRYTNFVRAGVILLSCLALATTASAQVVIADVPSQSPASAPDALLISADAGSCLSQSTLNIAAVSQKGSSSGVGSLRTSVCRWLVRGLTAGTYEVGLTHARGSGGRIRFDYVPGQLTELTIPAPAATITGVVRINGQAISGATIMFLSRPIKSGLPKVVTDQDGAFEATLAEAGQVSMRVSGRDVYGQSTSTTLNHGANRFEWDITGGTLVIRDVRARERTADFTISIWYNEGFQGGSAPSFGPMRELRGAPFGAHRVTITRGTAAEETVDSVLLSADAPLAEVVIDAP